MSLEIGILKAAIKELNKTGLADEIKLVIPVPTAELKTVFVETMDALLDDNAKAELVPDDIYDYYRAMPEEQTPDDESAKTAELGTDKEKTYKKLTAEAEKDVLGHPKDGAILDEDANFKDHDATDEGDNGNEIEEDGATEETETKDSEEETQEEDAAKGEPVEIVSEEPGDDVCPGFKKAFDCKAAECKACRKDYAADYIACKDTCFPPPKVTDKTIFNHGVDKFGGVIDTLLIEGVMYSDLVEQLATKFQRSVGKIRSMLNGHVTHLRKVHGAGMDGYESLSAKTPPKTYLKMDIFPDESK